MKTVTQTQWFAIPIIRSSAKVLNRIANGYRVVVIRLTAFVTTFVTAFTGFNIALNDSKSLLQKLIEVYE